MDLHEIVTALEDLDIKISKHRNRLRRRKDKHLYEQICGALGHIRFAIDELWEVYLVD